MKQNCKCRLHKCDLFGIFCNGRCDKFLGEINWSSIQIRIPLSGRDGGYRYSQNPTTAVHKWPFLEWMVYVWGKCWLIVQWVYFIQNFHTNVIFLALSCLDLKLPCVSSFQDAWFRNKIYVTPENPLPVFLHPWFIMHVPRVDRIFQVNLTCNPTQPILIVLSLWYLMYTEWLAEFQTTEHF